MKVFSRYVTLSSMVLIFSLHFPLFAAEKMNTPLPEFNPLSRYLTDDQYKQAFQKHSNEGRVSEFVEGKVLTINTLDVEGCQAVRAQFNLGAEVCIQDENAPLVSVVVMREVGQKYVEKQINLDSLSSKEKIALQSLRAFGVLGAGAFGVIYSLPESVSKWDKSRGFSALAGQWKERVSEGPVIDEDSWAVNYIGHPVTGALYYTVVRNQGFSRMESFAFSFAMSTFFWEYGIEAFAEIPSIQDIIVTPIIGSLMGELFHLWGEKIEGNHGELFGSRMLGKTASVLMDPAGAFSNKINQLLNHKVIKSTVFNLTNRPPLSPDDPNFDKGYTGLQLKMFF